MRVAIAVSGMGFINRGLETWGCRLVAELSKSRKLEVFLLKGAGNNSGGEYRLPCLKRNSIIYGGRSSPIGWGHRLGMEELTFSIPATLLAKTMSFDIMHIGQPFRLLFALKKRNMMSSEIIFMNPWLYYPNLRYIWVQQSAPYYLERAQEKGIDTSRWFVIPNFVDTVEFSPSSRSDLRLRLGIPEDAFVVLSVGEITKRYKRMDWLIREVSRLEKALQRRPYLVILGQIEDETNEIVQIGRDLLSDHVLFLTGLSRDEMPAVYSMSDLFVLCSAPESFGISFIEAMACGKPVVGHNYPVTSWIIGEGGDTVDMTREGALAEVIEQYALDEDLRREKGGKARNRAVEAFSKDKIVREILHMYDKVHSS